MRARAAAGGGQTARDGVDAVQCARDHEILVRRQLGEALCTPQGSLVTDAAGELCRSDWPAKLRW